MRQYQNRGVQVFALGGAVLVALFGAGAGACSDSAARECRVGADCASGICGSDGKCVPAAAVLPGPDGGANDDDASSSSDGSAPEASTDAALPGCSPNKDGTITRDEVPIVAGLHATYKIGKDEEVSTAGTPGAGGKRTWDFSAALASDVSVLVETQPLAGKWYASKFAGASYASKLSESSNLLGVFETSPGALLLRGVVSPTESSPKTELTDTPAVSVLKFPLTVGSKWTTDTDVSGTAQDFALVGTYHEKYTSEVDAAGTLKTPLGTFDVLRVKVVLVRTIGFLAPTTIRTFAFVTECYGTIATVTSSDNETNVEFTHAAEIRRISP
ncbi:MAG: hypothetical protein JWP87_4479 [Labilithrix sp.]|nr:hypothetical protein [Labilithrix sp.]